MQVFDWSSAWTAEAIRKAYIFNALVKILQIYYSLNCCALPPTARNLNMFSDKKIWLQMQSGITQISIYVTIIHWWVPTHNNACCLCLQPRPCFQLRFLMRELLCIVSFKASIFLLIQYIIFKCRCCRAVHNNIINVMFQS